MTPRTWKRLFARVVLWAGLLIAALLLVSLAQTTWHVYLKEQQAREAHQNEAEALAELTARKDALESHIRALDTPRGIEVEVRGRYDVARSGEEVIVLTESSSGEGAEERKAFKSFWERFLGWFLW